MCRFVYNHENWHTYSLWPAEFKSAGSRSQFSMGVAILDNSKWPPQFFFSPLLVKKKSCSYKSKHFDRVLDLRDSKFDVCLTGTLYIDRKHHIGKSNMAACKNRILHNYSWDWGSFVCIYMYRGNFTLIC